MPDIVSRAARILLDVLLDEYGKNLGTFPESVKIAISDLAAALIQEAAIVPKR